MYCPYNFFKQIQPKLCTVHITFPNIFNLKVHCAHNFFKHIRHKVHCLHNFSKHGINLHITFSNIFDLKLHCVHNVFNHIQPKKHTILITFSNKFNLMPRLHLLPSSYDLFVYDFLYDFLSIVGGYKLRRLCLHYLRSPYDFFRRQTRTKPYRDLADIVRQPQGYRTIIMLTSQIAHRPHDDLAEVARSWYAVCAIVV